MSVLDVLYTLLIKPLQIIFETLYMLTFGVIGDPGLSIIALSLMMNILVLPLYMRADAMQEAERQAEIRMRRGVAHIKKTFKGDEKMMMLQTYYRQNDYKPTDVFKGSVSLFLEIPFFIAAYLFLSNLSLLQGVPFGPIVDLGAPDGLLVIGETSINILPFIMTGINLVSCIIFTKGASAKQKIQLYGMAIFFLVFLYGSPSGLVFYWTLNNIFALGKTICYKVADALRAKKVANASETTNASEMTNASETTNASAAAENAESTGAEGNMFVGDITGSADTRKRKNKSTSWTSREPNRWIFFSGALLLAALVGGFIPTTVIGSDPAAFIDSFVGTHPLVYVAHAACLAFGMFVIWMGVFYWLANKRGKVIFEAIVWVACGLAILNFFGFGNTLGTLTNTLQYESGMDFATTDLLANAICVIALAAAMVLLFLKAKKLVPWVLAACAIATIGMSVYQTIEIDTEVQSAKALMEAENSEDNGQISFNLSRTGKNVVVLMMDRALAQYMPYFLNEKPELAEIYSGFTYYPNTISFGGHTNLASPAVFGGYEYTPAEMNKRTSQSLREKHNESLLTIPVLLSNNGFEATVIDAPFVNYSWTLNTSIFKAYEGIDAYVSDGSLYESGISVDGSYLQENKRNAFCFSFTKILPLFLQPVFYNDGNYNNSENDVLAETNGTTQTSAAARASFQKAYNTLCNLPAMSKITDEDVNTYMIMTNIATHDVTYMQEPEYIPASNVDNTAYEAAHSDRYTLNGQTLKMNNGEQKASYQSNMAALLKIGEWLTYLKKSGVYDNTRIIIVADHGFEIHHLDELHMDGKINNANDLERFTPLMMVKDFDAKTFTIDEQFMTNADTAYLSVQGLVDNPINPFTGKVISNAEKTSHPQYVTASWSWDVSKNGGMTFVSDEKWLEVSGDARVLSNWKWVSGPK